MTCEEYVLKELEDTKDQLKKSREEAANHFNDVIVLTDTLCVFWDHIKLAEYGGVRVIQVDNIWENTHQDEFLKLYDFFKSKFAEQEADNGEQSETCEPAES